MLTRIDKKVYSELWQIKPEEKKLELIKIGHIIWFWQLQKEEES